MERIAFYRTGDKFGEFSNFAKYPITLKNLEWPTTEHYFQAQKFVGTQYEEEIRLAPTAKASAEMGRDRSKPLRADWDDVKLSVMREALLAKFTQYSKLKELLLSTGDAVIVEHTKNDSYWGDGGDGSGKNMLGKLLMETRDYLVSQNV